MSLEIVSTAGVDAVLERSELLERLATASASYFHSPRWLRAWAEATGAEQMRLVTARAAGPDSGDDRVAALAMARLHRPLHRRLPLPIPYWGLAGSGYGAADHLGPVGDASLFDALLDAALLDEHQLPVMLESVDPAHERLLVERGFGVLRRTTCPRVDLKGVGDESEIWPKKLVKELRRRERRMSEEGIRGRWIEDPEQVRRALPSLRDVHLDRWRSRDRAGLFDEDRMRLLDALCGPPRTSTSPMMYVLESDRRVRASLLVLRCGDSMASYKSGWDPDLQPLGPGVAMHAAAIRRCLQEGGSTYDFLRGTSGHKYTLRAVDRFDVTMLHGSGPLAQLLRFRETDRSSKVEE